MSKHGRLAKGGTKAALAACALAIGMAAASASAEDVEIVTGAPLAAEVLAEKLFPEGPALGATRSIHLDDKPVVPKKSAIGFMVQFDLNSSDIRPESRPYLDEVGKMLQMDRLKEARLQVEGHADATGSDSYNKSLSQRRADAVANYLVRQYDIEPERLVVVGHGEDAPLDGRSPTDPENRRVQFRAVD